MTQVHIDAEKKICSMTFAGTGADLAADIGLIMGAVYQARIPPCWRWASSGTFRRWRQAAAWCGR